MKLASQSLAAIVSVMLCDLAGAQQVEGARVAYNIEPQPLSQALKAFGKQSELQLLVRADDVSVSAAAAPEVKGKLTPEEALQKLLASTDLRYEFVNARTVRISRVVGEEPMSSSIATPSVTRFAAAPPGASLSSSTQGGSEPPRGGNATSAGSESREDDSATGVPEILVTGSRILNTDIKRTEDDVQPYVVFDREQIARSNAVDVGQFLKTRLPMNTIQGMSSQAISGLGNQSSINLRGLGENQTLILVDGRRMPSVRAGGFGQPDVNGIPLSTIERIEVLPATASGIYGGGATGGVVNIITRRSSGVHVDVTYGDTFEADAANRRIDASVGLDLADGRTHLQVAVSHFDSDSLLTGDRDFVRRGRALQLAHNPAAFSSASPPPLGYTTNVCAAASATSTTCSSAPLVLDDGRSLSSNRTYVPVGYAGPGTDGGAALLLNAGQYDLNLPDVAIGGRQSLLNDPTVKSASLSVRHSITPSMDVFVDSFWTENEGEFVVASGAPQIVTLAANAPNNPFTSPIVVRFPSVGLSDVTRSTAEVLRAAAGLIFRLPREWSVGADYVWSRARYKFSSTDPLVGDPDGSSGSGLSATQALQSGLLDVMRDTNAFRLNFSPYLLPSPTTWQTNDTLLRDAALRVSGPLAQLAGGPLTVTGQISRREEEIPDTYTDSISSNAVSSVRFIPERAQTVRSYYVEARAPLVGKSRTLTLVNALELQASVRRDEYTIRFPVPDFVALESRASTRPAINYDEGQAEATKYTVGLRYAPVRDLSLRASFGNGFLPPSINQLNARFTTPNLTRTLIDPKRGNVASLVGPFTLTGGLDASALKPEESESWSVGAIFTPRFAPDLRLSVDYTRIEKTKEITRINFQDMLNLEDLLPSGTIARAPLTAADAALGYTGGAITAIDQSFINIQATRLEAYDVQLDYRWQMPWAAELRGYAVATYQPDFERKALPTVPLLDSVGFTGGPLAWRGNASLEWSRGGLTFGWITEYFDSYRVYARTATPATIDAAILNQGSATIPHQFYHDAFVRYRFGASSGSMGGILKNLEMVLGVQNVLDKSPPILATTSSVDAYSTYGDPRLRRYSFSVRKEF